MKTVEIYQDNDSINPIEDYSLSFFFGANGFGHGYLPEGDIVGSDFWDLNREDATARLNSLLRTDLAYFAPVYMYKHSGETISLTPFSCPWDSGQVGWVIVTKEDARNHFGIKRITQKYLDKIKEIVESEVDQYDSYIRGDMYLFAIKDENGNETDSCGGFIGTDIEANGMLDYIPSELHDAARVAIDNIQYQ